MGSKAVSSVTLLLCLNLVFFTMVTSHNVHCPPPPHKPPRCCQPAPGGSPPTTPKPSPSPPTMPKPSPSPPTMPKPSPKGNKCPIDILKLGACANVLGDLLGVVIGTTSKTQCCSLIQGLTDLEAAICLCIALRANVLGINLNVPISLSLLLNNCGKGRSSGFQCS